LIRASLDFEGKQFLTEAEQAQIEKPRREGMPEGKKLAIELGRFVIKAATSLKEKDRMKQKIHEALQGRVRKLLKEMRQERAHLAVGNYLHFRSAALSAGGMDETWGDLGRMIGKGAMQVAGQAVADGLGIKLKSGTLSRAIKAVRKKKKKYEVSRIAKKTKIARNGAALAQPIRMDRREFSKRLKASGNRLNKTSLS
jgi:hypothetical protein